MRPITLFRAAAWLGVVVVSSSLLLARWGVDPNLPIGPPALWERLVVGACLLALVSAMALSVSGRKRVPPSWAARAVAVAAAAGVTGLGVYMRQDALGKGFAGDMLSGQGWLWLMCGAGILTGAALGSFGLKAPRAPNKPRRRR
ncbi:hypothetical protein [Haliangium sp.]|uniref:hypothetical protein n=1 Tax=Haliangium sp. TaxID=2663208 RepID=UPI003D09D69B